MRRLGIGCWFALLATAAACSGGGSARPKSDGGAQPSATLDGSRADGAPSDAAVLAFQPDPPAVYVAKVKNMLVGLPPTDDEVAAVTADPTRSKALSTAGWSCPQYATKMQRFFELAFQQTQITAADFADQVYPQQIDEQRHDDAAARAERAGELRAHDAGADRRRAAAHRRR